MALRNAVNCGYAFRAELIALGGFLFKSHRRMERINPRFTPGIVAQTFRPTTAERIERGGKGDVLAVIIAQYAIQIGAPHARQPGLGNVGHALRDRISRRGMCQSFQIGAPIVCRSGCEDGREDLLEFDRWLQAVRHIVGGGQLRFERGGIDLQRPEV